MIGIWANVGAVVVGTAIGCFFKQFLQEKYIETLWIALGFAALGVGLQSVISNMPKSNYPVLFIISLAVGIPLGTYWQLDDRSNHWLSTRFSSKLGEGVATASFLDCIGALGILGPVDALYQRHADAGLRHYFWDRLWLGDAFGNADRFSLVWRHLFNRQVSVRQFLFQCLRG